MNGKYIAQRSEKVNKMFELAQSSKFPQSRYLQNLLAKTLVAEYFHEV